MCPTTVRMELSFCTQTSSTYAKFRPMLLAASGVSLQIAHEQIKWQYVPLCRREQREGRGTHRLSILSRVSH